MIYLPSNLINSNYTYLYSSNKIITIRTNSNCSTQYQTLYCDCYQIDTENHYIQSDKYSCSISSSSNFLLNSNTFSDEVFYRNDFADILIIFVIMCIFSFYIPIKIFSRIFKKGGL